MPERVTIHSEDLIFKKFIFKIIEAQLQHERYDGDMSATITRLKFERGDSVAALMHHPDDDTILLIEQFRYPAHAKDDQNNGWLLEVPAGVVESGETPDATMQREIIEETGYEARTLHHIHTFFVSPGGTSERIHLYYAQLDTSTPAHKGGGLEHEGEDIRVLKMTIDDALAKMNQGEIVDAKTLIALQWLQMNRPTLTTLDSGDTPSTSDQA